MIFYLRQEQLKLFTNPSLKVTSVLNKYVIWDITHVKSVHIQLASSQAAQLSIYFYRKIISGVPLQMYEDVSLIDGKKEKKAGCGIELDSSG